MGSIWFCLVAVMLAGYVVLDGFDIGAGILHLLLARDDAERRIIIRSIGPVWDGNEVWLLAAGGTLYFAFPLLYASAFSGFYLPLMMVLWLLVLRGISIEFRSHVGGRIWAAFWDGVFSFASILLAIFYGAALGNVVRGVPLDVDGHFFEPLWTTFLPAGRTGILDWYTVLIGVAALAVLSLHGAAWLVLKTSDDLHTRAVRCASRLWWLVAVLTAVVTAATFRLLPQHFASFQSHPLGLIFPLLAIAGLLGIMWFIREKQDAMIFASSCTYLLGMLTSVAFSLYPNLLPATTNPFFGLTIANSKAANYGLKIGLIWWVIGMALATAYMIHTYRSFAGKITAAETEEEKIY
ncbi:MAG: cytochrome d ubiquinol oxidase subunit II [Candidatus Acidiferrales bacterium]